MAVSASKARKTLFPLIERVVDDGVPVEITSRKGNAVLLSADEYRSLEETAHLLRSPVNARRLMEALDEAQRGDVVHEVLVDPDA